MLDAATADWVVTNTRASEPRVVERRKGAVRRALATMEMRDGAGRLREVIAIQTIAAPPHARAWITGALRYVPPAVIEAHSQAALGHGTRKKGLPRHGRIEFKAKRERKGLVGYRPTPGGVWRDALAIDDAWSLGEVEMHLEQLMDEHLRKTRAGEVHRRGAEDAEEGKGGGA